MKILFLDIDGVLNIHECHPEVGCGVIHRDKMHRLNTILRQTDCKVVLSSAWRYLVHRKEMTVLGLERLFCSHGMIKGRLIGVTRPDHSKVNDNYNGDPATWVAPLERGLQIHEYIDELWLQTKTALESFCVVDDLDLGISNHKLPFVQTHSQLGLQDCHVDKIIRILNK